jgi:SAM-dependent methyltransferase
MSTIEILWNNLDKFLTDLAASYDEAGLSILEIGPSDTHKTAKDYFKKAAIKTFDILARLKPDYVGDLCKNNSSIIPDNTFDCILCCEVFDHVEEPFKAAAEIYRMLRSGGLAFITTPFLLEIHPPFPDCWRFTEYGLKALLKDFKILKMEYVGPRAAPIQYTTIARKI